MSRCPATETWPEIGPHGVRLVCAFEAGHAGEHACADVEYLQDPAATVAVGEREGSTS